VMVTAAFVLAWFAAPVQGRTSWQTGLVGLGALASTWQILRLWLASRRPQHQVDKAWERMRDREHKGGADAPPSSERPCASPR
jgi:predicted kinase